MEHPSGHTRHTTHVEDDLQDASIQTGHNEDEKPEKKTMMMKVKAKARKIRDSIKNVGHSHDHDHDHDENDDDDDEEEEVEMDMDSEIQGTHTAQTGTPGKEEVTRQKLHEPKLVERTIGEDIQVRNRLGDYQTFDPTSETFTPGHDQTLGWSRTDTGKPKEYGGSHSTEASDKEMNAAAPVNLGGVVVGCDHQVPKDVGEDSHSANYQSEVIEPTVTGFEFPVAQSHSPANKPQGDFQTFNPRTDTERLNKSVEMFNESNNAPISAHSGHESHERTAMEGVVDAPGNKTEGDYQTFDPKSTSYVPGQEETLGWSRTDTGGLNKSEELSNLSNNTSTETHSGDEETRIIQILNQMDLMNVNEESQQKPTAPDDSHLNKTEHHNPPDEKISTESHHDQFFAKPDTSETGPVVQATTTPATDGNSYTGMISNAAAMVADKAMLATSAVTSKLGYGGPSTGPTSPDQQHSTTDVTSEMHDNNPSDKPVGTTYGERMSSATAVVTDKAIQAKDVVATKLGYGGNPDQQHSTDVTSEMHENPSEQPVGTTYGEKISSATTVVTDKAIQAKDVVAAKLGYGGPSTGPSTGPITGPSKGPITGPSTGPITWGDKGVAVKEYLVEKLKPGEDDKALSEVITEALPSPLHKPKEEGVTIIGRVAEPKEVVQMIDHIEEKNDDGIVMGEDDKAVFEAVVGKVGGGDEVAERLGWGEEKKEDGSDNGGAGVVSPGKGVMERIKDAASGWFQSSDEFPSQDTGTGTGHITQGTESFPISSMESEQKRIGGAGSL
ncbi:hypothetical protein SOVF_019650 [Spinacia oleracea]|nr:hypothetical protein SOVF_019650 [Spinacia oleracea]